MSSISRVPGPSQAVQAATDDRDPRAMAAAKMYEQQFLREMVKAMRRSVPESDLVPTSMGERIYREQLDDQYVEQWSDRGGVGFADIVYNHIMDRYVRPNNLPRPVGPIPLQQAKPMKPLETKQGLPTTGKLNLELTPIPGKTDLVAPWDGKIKTNQRTGSGMAHLMIEHGPGLRSEFLFDGISSLRPGDSVSAGQKLGIVSPDTQKLYWILSPS